MNTKRHNLTVIFVATLILKSTRSLANNCTTVNATLQLSYEDIECSFIKYSSIQAARCYTDTHSECFAIEVYSQNGITTCWIQKSDNIIHGHGAGVIYDGFWSYLYGTSEYSATYVIKHPFHQSGGYA